MLLQAALHAESILEIADGNPAATTISAATKKAAPKSRWRAHFTMRYSGTDSMTLSHSGYTIGGPIRIPKARD